MRIRGRLKARTRLRSIVHSIWPPKPKPLILIYHRIADEPIDPWGNVVSPACFEEHLSVLRRTRHPLPLSEFIGKLTANTLPQDAVALTFDDGYVDNLVSGEPLLASADVPATVFLATGYINRDEPFWWDELARLILVEHGPRDCEFVVRGQTFQFDFSTRTPIRADSIWDAASLTGRRQALWRIWKALRPLEDQERRRIMVELRSKFTRRDDHASLGRAMTPEEVSALIAGGLVTIGAHTVTHPVLSGLGAAACHREITESKLACDALAGAPVAAFAYPYGDFDADAREAVKAAGFTFACSVRRSHATAACDTFALPRVSVPNVGGEAFEETLRSISASGRT